MNNKNNLSRAALGNYTKSAVKEFEKNIVNKKDYLEEVKKNK
ncbi:hypothetical protein [Clostridium sp. LIBA-8841]|nr:hypothetical protein [Clostridium sp. LIBA-8841]MDZ5253421.1 hypothetical protein [Clostridium sp. LIBA-8841]